MMKFTLKDLKSLLNHAGVVDLTHATEEDRRRVMSDELGWLDQIGYAAGVYGCNGKLFRGHETGLLYVIAGRTTALFLF